jgi:hypothetical protein
MKTKTLLIAAVMFLGLSAAAFAQATFQVGSIPVTTVVATGNTEKTGDITFTYLSGTVIAGTLNVAYGTGINITNPTSGAYFPTIAAFGCFAATPPTINTIQNSPGLLIINVPATAGCVGGAVNDSFVLQGVRVQIAGTGVTTVDAQLSAVGNALVAGQTNPRVITNVAAGLDTVTASTAAQINAVTGNVVSGSPVTITVKEGFLSAFEANAGIRIRFPDHPPAGVTFSFPTAFSSTTSGSQYVIASSTGSTTGTIPSTITATSSNQAIYYVMVTPGATATTTVENLPIPVTVSNTSTVPVPLEPSVTALVSLAPIANATPVTNPIPRYAEAEIGPVTLLTIVGSRTALLIPFVQVVPGFDTGISIANTTADVSAATMGITNDAVAQSGTITFRFFPAYGSGTQTVTTYVTSGTSPGSGLDANGQVLTGSTYVVLVSQLLEAAGLGTEFTGYIIVVTQFTNAHGLYVLMNNTLTFGQGALMMVLSNRTALPEILGF